jgi:hypothetical protein
LSSIAHLLTRIDIALCYTTFVKIIRGSATLYIEVVEPKIRLWIRQIFTLLARNLRVVETDSLTGSVAKPKTPSTASYVFGFAA